MKRGKNYLAAQELIDIEKVYSLEEAAELVKKTSVGKFDATVELHLKTGLDVKQSDQNLRITTVLPEGTGKDVKVIAIVGDDKVKECKEAGAMEAGGEELVERIVKDNWLDFDKVVATPDMMRVIAKAAKVLGTRGMMPNPKAGTVNANPAKVVKDLKGGMLEIRLDPQAIIHIGIGKVSFDEKKLLSNLEAVVTAIKDNKPSACKGQYVESATLTSTMGPAIKINFN